jgi:PAS domain S-box-containing protein
MSIIEKPSMALLTDAQRFAAIVEFSDDAIITTDLNGVIASWNTGAQRLFGYSPEETRGQPVLILIPPERHDEEPAILERIRRGERIEHYETVRRRKDGSYINISLTVSPIKDADGTVIGASKIARDISERKQSEAQIAALAREAEHRAKNVLAVVQAIVRLSHAETTEGLKETIYGRIRALANVHALFVQSRWTGASLRSLVVDELSPYSTEGTSTRIDGPPVLLPQDAAQTIAVALHELATNAAKYGALSREGGHVDVVWSQTEDGLLGIHWAERGGPPVSTPSHRGFGTRVIDSMLRVLNGKVYLDWRPEGLECKIVLPQGTSEVNQRRISG